MATRADNSRPRDTARHDSAAIHTTATAYSAFSSPEKDQITNEGTEARTRPDTTVGSHGRRDTSRNTTWKAARMPTQHASATPFGNST